MSFLATRMSQEVNEVANFTVKSAREYSISYGPGTLRKNCLSTMTNRVTPLPGQLRSERSVQNARLPITLIKPEYGTFCIPNLLDL